MFASPTIWESIRGPLAVIGWASIITLVATAFIWAWKLRGWVDSYLGTQKEALLQVAKTLSAVEEAKKVAMDRVEIALKDGSTQASEIKALTEENKVKIEANALALQTLSGNHLAHISSGIGDLNAKTDRMVEVLTTMGSDIKILVDRGLRG